MIEVRNNLIPFSGFKSMAMWPFLFIRKKVEMTSTLRTHEYTHGRQQLEVTILMAVLYVIAFFTRLLDLWWMVIVPTFYYAFYGLEYVVRWICYGFDTCEAYRNISFEQEAYLNENDLTYIKNRHLFAWRKYLFRKTYHRK